MAGGSIARRAPCRLRTHVGFTTVFLSAAPAGRRGVVIGRAASPRECSRAVDERRVASDRLSSARPALAAESNAGFGFISPGAGAYYFRAGAWSTHDRPASRAADRSRASAPPTVFSPTAGRRSSRAGIRWLHLLGVGSPGLIGLAVRRAHGAAGADRGAHGPRGRRGIGGRRSPRVRRISSRPSGRRYATGFTMHSRAGSWGGGNRSCSSRATSAKPESRRSAVIKLEQYDYDGPAALGSSCWRFVVMLLRSTWVPGGQRRLGIGDFTLMAAVPSFFGVRPLKRAGAPRQAR